jgi:hypothetical protein
MSKNNCIYKLYILKFYIDIYIYRIIVNKRYKSSMRLTIAH